MGLIGRILNASNAFLGVNNVQGAQAPLNETTWLPLGTAGGSATGEIAVKVILAGSSGGSGGTFTSNPALVTSNGSIPSGVKSWSFSAVSGTVTLGGATIPNGTSLSGGGYVGQTMASSLAYTITAGSALVTYDT